MKRLFLLIVATLFVSVGYAQSVKFSAPDIDVKFKRCICSGNTAYIDLVMTNWSNKDISPMPILSDPCNNSRYTSAYDDEGNMYKFLTNLGLIIGGEVCSGGPFNLPREIPVKVRVFIKNLDDYARTITMLKVAFYHTASVERNGAALLEIRNIPITRQ